jgi:sulfatase modifying factor 1
MGSPAGETGRRADEAQVKVEITRGFWMGTFEVTQGQWRRTVGAFPGRQPSPAFGEGDDFPVYWVSYEQAERFCRVLTSRAHESGASPTTRTFGLPTEAQWEYACRAGTTTATAFGDTLGADRANFDPDLSGVPGVRNGDGSYSRVRRGGAWLEAGWACRSACRLRYEHDRSSDHIGFRVAVLGG